MGSGARRTPAQASRRRVRSFTNGHYVGRTEFQRICAIDVKPLKEAQLLLKSVIANFKHMGDSVSARLARR